MYCKCRIIGGWWMNYKTLCVLLDFIAGQLTMNQLCLIYIHVLAVGGIADMPPAGGLEHILYCCCHVCNWILWNRLLRLLRYMRYIYYTTVSLWVCVQDESPKPTEDVIKSFDNYNTIRNWSAPTCAGMHESARITRLVPNGRVIPEIALEEHKTLSRCALAAILYPGRLPFKEGERQLPQPRIY